MGMMWHRLQIALGLVLVLGGCAPIRVTTYYDQAATGDFSGLRTYAWRTTPQQGPHDPRVDYTFLEDRVTRAMDRELTAKGYRKVGAVEHPDFIVGYHVVVQRNVDEQTIGGWYGYDFTGYRGWRGPPGTVAIQYDQGSLLLDILDPQNNQLRWRGTATTVVRFDNTIEEREKRIDDAVKQVLAQFPPH